MPNVEWNPWPRLGFTGALPDCRGYNTGFGYVVFSALYLLFGNRVHYLLIGLAAHLVAVVNAFWIHRRFVFRSNDHGRRVSSASMSVSSSLSASESRPCTPWWSSRTFGRCWPQAGGHGGIRGPDICVAP